MIHRVAGASSQPYTAPPAPSEPLELGACYRYCEAMARARHHNFPVASMFVPTALRRHVFPVYAFVRTADEIATDPRYEGRRARELDAWESRLERCFHGEAPDHPVFLALADTVARFDLPITPFSAIVAGCRTDLDRTRYSTFADLTNYCSMAAAPLAHLFLYLGGYRDAGLHRHAEDLAVAMALASFWQDVRADLNRGRIYIPVEDLRHFGLGEQDLLRGGERPALTALLRFEVARTRAMFEKARPLVDHIGHDMAIEVALIWHGGMRILDKIAAVGGDILETRPHLTQFDKALVVTRALAWRGGSLSRRGASLWRWVRGPASPLSDRSTRS